MNISNTTSTQILFPNLSGKNSQIAAGDSFFPDPFPLQTDTFHIKSSAMAQTAPPMNEFNKETSPDKQGGIEKLPEKPGVTPKTTFTFRDFLDVINPLQHLPIVGNIYRAITHDEIKAPARILGGGLFGGMVGAAIGIVNSIFSKLTGKDIGEHVASLFKENDTIASHTQTDQDGEKKEALHASSPEGIPMASVSLTRTFPDALVETADSLQSSLEKNIGNIHPANNTTAPGLRSIPFEQRLALADYQRIAAQLQMFNNKDEPMESTLDLYH